jgi:pentatricopeptide repeat protein
VQVRLLQKKMQAAGVPVDGVVYGTIIKAYLRARRPVDAEAVLVRPVASRVYLPSIQRACPQRCEI